LGVLWSLAGLETKVWVLIRADPLISILSSRLLHLEVTTTRQNLIAKNLATIEL